VRTAGDGGKGGGSPRRRPLGKLGGSGSTWLQRRRLAYHRRQSWLSLEDEQYWAVVRRPTEVVSAAGGRRGSPESRLPVGRPGQSTGEERARERSELSEE
jgi:hypothetical protein